MKRWVCSTPSSSGDAARQPVLAQVTLADALAYLATNLNGTSATVTFQYNKNGDGAFTAADSTFVFQDGASDTVVELAGLYTGVNAAAGAGLITLA